MVKLLLDRGAKIDAKTKVRLFSQLERHLRLKYMFLSVAVFDFAQTEVY